MDVCHLITLTELIYHDSFKSDKGVIAHLDTVLKNFNRQHVYMCV